MKFQQTSSLDLLASPWSDQRVCRSHYIKSHSCFIQNLAITLLQMKMAQEITADIRLFVPEMGARVKELEHDCLESFAHLLSAEAQKEEESPRTLSCASARKARSQKREAKILLMRERKNLVFKNKQNWLERARKGDNLEEDDADEDPANNGKLILQELLNRTRPNQHFSNDTAMLSFVLWCHGNRGYKLLHSIFGFPSPQALWARFHGEITPTIHHVEPMGLDDKHRLRNSTGNSRIAARNMQDRLEQKEKANWKKNEKN
jgi:hypothetical protein